MSEFGVARSDGAEKESKLKEIENKIKEVRHKKDVLSPLPKYRRKQKQKSQTKSTEVHPKEKKFYHPHLNYVIYEIANSPYLTNPHNPYPNSTLKLVKTVEERRSRSEPNISTDELEKAKKVFIDEVVNFKGNFLLTDILGSPEPFRSRENSPNSSKLHSKSAESPKHGLSQPMSVWETTQDESSAEGKMTSKSNPEISSNTVSLQDTDLQGVPARNRKEIQIVTRTRKEQADRMVQLSVPPPNRRAKGKSHTYGEGVHGSSEKDEEEGLNCMDKEELEKKKLQQSQSMERLSTPTRTTRKVEDINKEHSRHRSHSPTLHNQGLLNLQNYTANLGRLASPKHSKPSHSDPNGGEGRTSSHSNSSGALPDSNKSTTTVIKQNHQDKNPNPNKNQARHHGSQARNKGQVKSSTSQPSAKAVVESNRMTDGEKGKSQGEFVSKVSGGGGGTGSRRDSDSSKNSISSGSKDKDSDKKADTTGRHLSDAEQQHHSGVMANNGSEDDVPHDYCFSDEELSQEDLAKPLVVIPDHEFAHIPSRYHMTGREEEGAQDSPGGSKRLIMGNDGGGSKEGEGGEDDGGYEDDYEETFEDDFEDDDGDNTEGSKKAVERKNSVRNTTANHLTNEKFDQRQSDASNQKDDSRTIDAEQNHETAANDDYLNYEDDYDLEDFEQNENHSLGSKDHKLGDGETSVKVRTQSTSSTGRGENQQLRRNSNHDTKLSVPSIDDTAPHTSSLEPKQHNEESDHSKKDVKRDVNGKHDEDDYGIYEDDDSYGSSDFDL